MKTKFYLLTCFLLLANYFFGQEVSLVKDISTHPIYDNSNPRYLTEFNGAFYFNANQDDNGYKLWKSDGTTQGTQLFFNEPGNNFTILGNLMYFISSTKIYKTDGTQNGTELVIDLNTGINTPLYLTAYNGKLYFQYNDGIHNSELWTSDGTAQGTLMLKDINLVNSTAANQNLLTRGSEPRYFTVYNGKLYFSANDGNNGFELWESDGTSNGTKLAVDINIGTDNSLPTRLTVYNNKLFFSAKTNDTGHELWMSDGTESGTSIVKDINLGTDSSLPTDGSQVFSRFNMVILNNKLYFTANDNNNFTNYELWSTDGTSNGTVMVKNLFEGSTGSEPQFLTTLNNKLYFSAKTSINNGFAKRDLYESDGTEVGTKIVTEVNNFNINFPEYLLTFNNKIYLSISDTNGFGNELFSFTPKTSNNQPTTDIPDENFEQHLITNQLDDVLDGKVVTANINGLTILNLSNTGVEDLTGIQDFTALEQLFVSNNPGLTTIDVSNNFNLKILNTSSTGISSINIAANTNLEEFISEYTGLSFIDISTNFNLKKLFLRNNSFSSFDLFNTNQLEELDLSHNQLVQFNLAQGFSLKKLYVNHNLLPDADFTGLSLEQIRIYNNNLSSLIVSNVQGITSFDARNNSNLSCIQVDDVAFANANFTNIDSQTSFSTNCSNADSTYIPDDNFEQALIDLQLDNVLDDYVLNSNIANITALDLYDKGITDLTGIEGFTSLSNLDISKNNLSTVNLSSNPTLQYLSCDECSLTSLNINSNTNLIELSVVNNTLQSLDFSQNAVLESISAGMNAISAIDLSSNTSIKYVSLYSNQLAAIDLSRNTNLETLIIYNNALTGLNLSSNISLKELLVQNNQLRTLDIKNGNNSNFVINNGERAFDARNNTGLACITVDDATFATTNFTKVDSNTTFSNNCGTPDGFTNVPDDLFEQKLIDLGYDDVLDNYVLTANIENITSLEIENINIDDLTGLEAFVSLETLILKNLSFDTIDLTPFSNLKSLNLFRNLLRSVDVSSNTALEVLSLAENRLTNLDLSQNTNLEHLSLNYNELTSIDISSNTKLKTVNILGNSQGNQITSIDLSSNTLLEEVHLQGNLLTSIDVSNNRNLTHLFVPQNNISAIDVSNNLALERLSLTSNNLSSLDVSMLQNLAFLYTSDNNLSCISVYDVAFANQQYTQFADSSTFFVSDCDDIVAIPDSKFEEKLIELQLDDEINGYIVKSRIETVESLNISTSNSNTNKITNLTGIAAFTSLKSLRASFQDINNVDLSSNQQLEDFSAQFSNINTIMLPNSDNLILLDLQNNNLSDIDLSNNPNLQSLYANGNGFSSIDISQNLNIETLSISNNALSTLEISRNKNLRVLNASFIGISDLNLSENINLERVNIDRNSLTNIDLSNLTLLENLNCSRNNLVVLDLTQNIRLTNLDATTNNLSCIKVWDVDFANQNWSSNIDSTASFGDSCYTEIPDANFEQALIDAKHDDILDGYILISTANSISTLELASKNISDLAGIEAFTSLTSLNAKGNSLTSINLSENTTLETLVLNNNQLDRLDISTNTSLTSFEAKGNANLTCIQVWDENYANANWSDKIDATASFSENCDDVWTIEVDQKTGNILVNISGIDKDGDGEITLKEAKEFVGELDLSNKQIDDIEGLQAFTGVKKLNLSGNSIKDLSALTGKKITLISKSTGKRRTVNTDALSLEELVITNNNLQTLNLENLTNLKVVDVSNNPDLVTMSIKNGNNAAITSFNSTNTPNMTCIIVNDKNASYLSTWNTDSKNQFVSNIAECRSAVLSTQEFLEKDVAVFPNPVISTLTIRTTLDLDSVEIFNALGKLVKKSKTQEINVSELTSGLYFIKITSGNAMITKRIIKR